jgi:ribose/xylose/arabinose/galactoside ABC-type transport system permease subunit
MTVTSTGPSAQHAEHTRRDPVGRIFDSRFGPYVGLTAAFVVLVVVMAVQQDAFLTQANLTNILRSCATTLVLSAGMTLVVLTGGVDLSVASSLALSGVCFGVLVADHGVNEVFALVVVLGFGAVLGFVNGFLIGLARMSFFVVTLGTLSLYRGIALLWQYEAIDMYDRRVPAFLGNDAVLGDRIPISFLVALGVCALFALLLGATRFGRSVFAVGGNREAAELSGIRSGRVICLVYVIAGVTSALGAVMYIGRTTSAVGSAASGLELNVVAAVLLGGVALSGGVGSVWGTLLAVMFLQVLSNALNLAGVSGFWQQIVTGVILIGAIYLDSLRTRRQNS